MTQLPDNAIVITGLGMCSSLGNVVAACAAARAGLSMPRDLEEIVITARDGADAILTGHPVAIAAGFRGHGKLVCLGFAALQDLLEQNDLRSQNLEKTGFYLCLPDQVASPHSDNIAQIKNRVDGSRLCAQLTALASLPVPQANWKYTEEGHTGFIRAVIDASARIRAGSWYRCLIGGLGSLLDTAVVESLHALGRIKTPDKPDGFQPGEAGAFVLLERVDVARRRGSNPMACVDRASMTTEPNHAQSNRPCNGAGLTEAIKQVLDDLPAPARNNIWTISDHNGEFTRASELGNAIVRAAPHFPTFGLSQPWCSATSFGDTNSASAAIAACLVTRAFVQGYAPTPRALILSSSDRELRGALLLKKDWS